MSTSVRNQNIRPSLQVVEQVADVKGVAADELSPLFETIDSDALDALLQTDTVNGKGLSYVQFQYEGHTIVVHGDGSVEVAENDS